MKDEKEIYTGTLTYREIDFTFVFSNDELRLIPPKDRENDILFKWGREEIAPGVYSILNYDKIGENVLIGKCNETGSNIIFFTQKEINLGKKQSVLIIPLTACIICRHNKAQIDRVKFEGPEINYIHPINRALELKIDDEFFNQGVVNIATREFDKTETEEQFFSVNDKKVTSHFTVSRNVSTKINESPLTLNSSLVFDFDATEDYDFILELWSIAREYIRFLCYRRNIRFSRISIWAPCDDGKHEEFANMIIIGLQAEQSSEEETLQSGRYIKQIYVSEHEGEILSDIASKSLYLRHLPKTYKDGKQIDAARFVMIMAAFEWEYGRLHPEGVKKSEAKIKAEESVLSSVDEFVSQKTGKEKDIWKFLRKLVRSDALETKIKQVGEELHDTIGMFGEHLYRLNNEKLVYKEMGNRLANQRNHFAHGDLDKEFIGLSLLDLIFMEFVVYAMQLKYYKIDDENIKRAINDLFHRSFAI